MSPAQGTQPCHWPTWLRAQWRRSNKFKSGGVQWSYMNALLYYIYIFLQKYFFLSLFLTQHVHIIQECKKYGSVELTVNFPSCWYAVSSFNLWGAHSRFICELSFLASFQLKIYFQVHLCTKIIILNSNLIRLRGSCNDTLSKYNSCI